MRFTDSSRYEGEFMQVNSHTIAFLAKMSVILFCCQPQGWFHGHGLFTTIDGMKYEGGECAPIWRDKKVAQGQEARIGWQITRYDPYLPI